MTGYWFLTVLIIMAYIYMMAGPIPLVGWKREIPIK